MKDYRVDLDVYNGPLDLLLFLIRREEVDIHDIPISRITGQFVEYVNLLEQIDPNLVGDFLVMAATLMEIKSRMLLPKPPAEEVEEEDFSDPRLELVRQLLEYKTYKDAARKLGVSAEIQQLKRPRRPQEIETGPTEVDIEDVQVWDLLEAFSRLLEQTGKRSSTHDVIYDDTPISLHAADVIDSLSRRGGRQNFEEIFEGRTKSQMIGLFLAVLELVRKKRVRVAQEQNFATIALVLLDDSPIEPGFDDGYLPEEATPEQPDEDAEDEEFEDIEEEDFESEDDEQLDADSPERLELTDPASEGDPVDHGESTLRDGEVFQQDLEADEDASPAPDETNAEEDDEDNPIP